MKTFSIALTDDTVTSLQVIADLRGDAVGDLIMEAIKNYHYPVKKRASDLPLSRCIPDYLLEECTLPKGYKRPK